MTPYQPSTDDCFFLLCEVVQARAALNELSPFAELDT